MHNNFLDKRRRHLRLQPDQVDLILPEHFAASYPKFIDLLTFYYEFQQEEKSTELLHHLFASRDISETDITLLSYIEDELLLGDAYFESFATGEAQKRAAANFSNTLFRSKGTKFAIQWFFRSFFGIDAEVVETNEQIFTIGNAASTIGTDSLHFLTDDKLYQTFAYLVRSSIPITKWRDLFKLFVHPAGMYLGAELLISDRAFASLLTTDSDGTVTQRNTPQFTVSVDPSLVESEGTTFEVHLQGTDVLNSQGEYRYYIRHDTTDSNDFDYAYDSVFPDILNKRRFTLSNDSATILVPTFHDSDESEADSEQFTMFFEDLEGRTIAQQQISIADVVGSYTITPSATTIDEGDSVQFSVTGTSVPCNGSTTLFYQVFPGTTDSDDFLSGTFPSVGVRQPFDIRNDSGSFSVQTQVDGTTEGSEDFTVQIFTASNINKGTSSTITVNNVAPTFNVTPDPTLLVTEGSNIAVNIEVDASTVGRDVDFSIGGGDSRIITKSGTFTLTEPSTSYTLTTTEASDTFETSTTSSLTLTTNTSGFFSPELTSAIVIDLENAGPTYTATPDTFGVAEGGTVTFNISGTNIPDGNTTKYYLDLGTADTLDFTTAQPTSVGTASLISMSSNAGSVAITFTDSSEADNETFDFVLLDSDDIEKDRVGYTIIGGNSYSITTPSGGTAVEPQTLVAYFNTDDADGTYYYYVAGAGMTSDDFSAGYASSLSRGTFSVSGGNGSISLTVKADQRREGEETFRIYVSKGASDAVVASTNDITISDTSVPTYTLTLPDITEGDNLVATVTPDAGNAGSENIYVSFQTTSTGDSASITTPQPLAQSISNIAKDFTSATSVQNQVSGNITVTATARLNSYSGTVVATDTCDVSDAAASYTLVTNKTNDSAEEGETFQFTFGGSNVPTATYYYNVSDVKPKTTDQTVSAGSTTIYLSDTTNLTVGMEERGIAFPTGATITSINAGNYVTMSIGNNELSNVAAGTTVHFAEPEVFADFVESGQNNDAFGTISHTTNTSTNFDVETADTDDVPVSGRTTQYTMNISASHGGSAVKTRTFTIGDDDTAPAPNVQRGSMTDPDTFTANGEGGGDDTSATIYLLSTGAIRVNLDNTIYGDIVTNLGNWVDDTGAIFTNSDFECIATLVSSTNNNSSLPGDFGTILNLGTSRAWQVKPPQPGDGDIEIANSTFDLLIREVANTSNSITTRIILNASMIDFI